MALLTPEQINAADDRRWEDITVPEWGGEVRLLGLSGTAREAYERSALTIAPNGAVQRRLPTDARARLLALCMVDTNFERIYSDKQIGALGAKSGAVLDRLFDVAKRLSGLDKAAVEAAEGNSGSGQSGASTSA